MRQAGLLEEGGIVAPLLSREVRLLLDQRAPSDLRFFPVRSSL